MREFSPRADLQQRKAVRRLSGLVLPVEKVSALNRFIAEYRKRDVLIRHNVPCRNTLLLYGPSGNGKTAIAESIANELKLPFSVTMCGQIVASYLGETEKNLHDLFDWARRTSAVLLFDECDSLVSARAGMGTSSASDAMRRAVNTILAGLDGIGTDSILVFASNFGEKLDPAFLRRMSIQMLIDAPSIEAKRELVRRLRQRWSFIPDGDWLEKALQMPSFAECELAVAQAARDFLLKDQA